MKNFFQKNFRNTLNSFFLVVLFVAFIVTTENSYAVDCSDITQCGTGRIRSCDSSGNPSSLGWSPVESSDIMFDMSNPVCVTVFTTSYAAAKAGIALMNQGCSLGLTISATPSPIADALALAKGTIKAGTDANCRPYYFSALALMNVAFGELMIIYGISTGVFDNTTLCGANWTTPDTSKYNISKPGYKATVESAVKTNSSLNSSNKQYREWYYGGQEYEDHVVDGSDYCEDPTGTNIKTSGHFPKQKYYLKGTDTGNFNCKQYDLTLSNSTFTASGTPNPNATVADYNKAYACCKNRSQNFVCIDFHNEVANAGQPYPGGVFCKSGSRCTISGITFSAAPIDDGDSRMICAQSYSLCPYNFTIGKGGSKYCDYFQDGVNGTMITTDDIANATKTDPVTGLVIGTQDCNTKSEIRNADCTFNAKAGQCKNYCQYLTHCVKVGSSDYQYQSSLDSPYFSSACFNFVGDSRNQTGYGSSASVIGSQRHFSAPIAQCVKETLENVFYNTAGHSKCALTTEIPSANGVCPTGNYMQSGAFTYKVGNQVKETSFFQTLQNNLQSAVKMALTLSIIFYGIKILIGNAEIKKSDILMFILKIGLVMYFATGDAWQGFFFKGVYNASSTFSKMVFHIDSTMADDKKDGCQFDATTVAANPYPANKDYLSMWDTLDCKIARYLGYGPEVSVANICMLIIGSIFTGPYGSYFAIALMFFGFFFISVAIRALHIFLSSAMAIILMVYISPIIIPTVMFGKTGSIFKQWLTNLIGFCLQPMILFAYIAVFISAFDSTMIGSATFSGTAPQKTISCDPVCKDDNNNVVADGDVNCTQAGHSWSGGTCQNAAGDTIYADTDPGCLLAGNKMVGQVCRDANGLDVGGDSDCSQAGHTMVDPLTDSIACLINVDQYAKYPGLSSIGLSIPVLFSLFTDHVKEKILTMVKAALVMYVLCQFLDQIPSITGQLIGGSALQSKGMSAMAMMKKVSGGMEAIENRARRGGMKAGKESAEMARGANMGEALSKGKSADDSEGSSGSNRSGED